MVYRISPGESQRGLIELLRNEFEVKHGIKVLRDADIDNTADIVERNSDGTVFPFLIVWFHMPRRARRGRSFGSSRTDERVAMADIVSVAASRSEVLGLANEVMDFVIEKRPLSGGGGKLIEADRQLWDEPMSHDVANKPSRWALPYSVEWGLSPTVTP